ncbi:hydroxypyruvate isomerase [Prosthecobacter fusiformis]|uniref:Hydroxypyruvate isomerase n=1 Tax=Prosthecobacter fusiformis TaxID=48464 RepID=A0A4R7RMU2_9BACT|nr:TIM barrel protein [Prosthecobacter fusiformis]TDU64304.1 hydroxypyruvate isomerase [Prosthecobacter fusiformis]
MTMTSTQLPRRQFLNRTLGVAAVVALLKDQVWAAEAATTGAGKVKHSVCKWCYKDIPLETLCLAAKEIGLESIELLDPPQFETVKKHGLHCAMVSFPTIQGPAGEKIGSIPHGFNRLEHHDLLVQAYEPLIKASAEAGFKQVICFSGNRDGLDDDQGLTNCAAGLQRLMPLCEKQGVTLVMELLNSKVNHPDYMCDKSAWGVALCEKLGSSPHFKLLYDIYHMQIMEGDVVATIRRDHAHFAHYHTGGVPGRAEIDDTQELNYPAIIRAIQDTGYTGYLGQEFVPKKADKLASLKQAVGICSVS